MEEDAKELVIGSKFLQNSLIQKQMVELKKVVEEASQKISYESAHNPEILYALDIITQFLRKKGRVCYGGMAINSILPKQLKFYNFDKELPDYDFFTPNLEEDIKEIVKNLRAAGFTEVNERIGIHEGTHKILVNFTPVADMSVMNKVLYDSIYDRSVVKDGIHYCDHEFLRMMMYLELSRPRGQVERWEKVYERLLLLNSAFPIKSCSKPFKISSRSNITNEKSKIFDFLVDKGRILIGAGVISLYNTILHKKNKEGKKQNNNITIQWILNQRGPLISMSPHAIRDAIDIRQLLSNDDITVETIRGGQEVLPDRVVIYKKNTPILMIIQETACHSLNVFEIIDSTNNTKKKINIGSLDTMLTIYLSFSIFANKEMASIVGFPVLCLCQKLMDMNKRLKEMGGKDQIPAFSIDCKGYQKGYSTLLREKAGRIARQKQKNATRKRIETSDVKNKMNNNKTHNNKNIK